MEEILCNNNNRLQQIEEISKKTVNLSSFAMDFSSIDICRLCAKSEASCKDILDQNNIEILQLCHDLVHVTVIKNDGLPSKVCQSCEEKMVSFNLFVKECNRTQDLFKNKTIFNGSPEEIETDTTPVKFEAKTEHLIQFCLYEEVDEQWLPVLGISQADCTMDSSKYNIFSQVKEEIIADDDFPIDIDTEGFSDINTAEYESDLLDDITIASLRKIKAKNKSLNISKRKTNCKLKALFRMVCEICNEPVRNWTALETHHLSAHGDMDSQPVQHCVCGYASYSQSALYKHYKEHKSDDDCERKKTKIKVGELLQYVCKICRVDRGNWTALETHYRKQHKAPPEVDCSCGFVIKSRSSIYKHIQTHKNSSEGFSCDLCSKISKTEAALQRHKELKHLSQVKEMKCAMCDKVFTNKELLKSHVRSHIPVEERKCHTCPCCNTKFTTRSAMMSHKKVVHDKLKSYVCDQCGYACGTNGELKQHRAIHSDEKPFVCSKCSKPFKTYSNLKTHMDTHEDTSYACYVCGRVLNSRRTLRKHLLVHQSECRHVCTYCNKAFKRRQTLKVHLSTHTGDKPMSCKWCDEKFAYASTLRSHRLRFHPDKVVAPTRPYVAEVAAAAAADVVAAANYNQAYEVNIKVNSNADTLPSWKVNVL